MGGKLLIIKKYHGKVLVVKLYKRVKGIAGLEWVFLHPRYGLKVMETMKLAIYCLILFNVVGCAVSSPQPEYIYTGKEISNVLVIPESGIEIPDTVIKKLDKKEKEKFKTITELVVDLEKISKAKSIKKALILTEMIDSVEIAKSEDYESSNYDFIVKSTGRSVPSVQKQNCEFFYFITAVTLGIIPSVCSERHYYIVNVITNSKIQEVEYEFVSKSVTGWFAYILINFEGWGEYYNESIAEENFGHKIIMASQ